MTPVTLHQADWVTHQTYNELSRLEHCPAGTICIGEGLAHGLASEGGTCQSTPLRHLSPEKQGVRQKKGVIQRLA